ncbi:YraN family protein [Leucobacter sp. UT-8R-CII-1-4]|uniref:YraN family protein n=1 Tax=Leucobacter sp. UT-8R-CII-1-4 TaxID=3040075 RepID=UPI0024A8FA5B|nr:YraN family protein [Leucobacter sp. UT-8R-CII-1-4]MDI6023076.1 YraN family protein [Leucobacter sp. UT-8R-CII-1-4]
MTDTAISKNPQGGASRRRSHNLELGARGEQIAAEYLLGIGCEILSRNWRSGRTGELDLVVRERGVLVAVEVKTRSGTGYGSPLEAITARKTARLRELLLSWVRAHRPVSGKLRIDAIAVTLSEGQPPQITHLRGIS